MMMKNLLLITTLITLASCGKTPEKFAHNLVKDLGQGIEALGQVPRNIGRATLAIDSDKADSDKADKELNKDLNNLKDEVDSIKLDITYLYSLVDNLDHDQDDLSQEVAMLTARVAELESYENIVEFIDPCGDYPNHFDEIIFKTSSGKFVAYFKSGSNEFLAELPNGNFRTSDKQKCDFRIENGELLD